MLPKSSVLGGLLTPRDSGTRCSGFSLPSRARVPRSSPLPPRPEPGGPQRVLRTHGREQSRGCDVRAVGLLPGHPGVSVSDSGTLGPWTLNCSPVDPLLFPHGSRQNGPCACLAISSSAHSCAADRTQQCGTARCAHRPPPRALEGRDHVLFYIMYKIFNTEGSIVCL